MEIYNLKRIILKCVSEGKHHIFSALYVNLINLLLAVSSSQLPDQMPVMMVNLKMYTWLIFRIDGIIKVHYEYSAVGIKRDHIYMDIPEFASTVDPWTRQVWTAWVHLFTDFFQ